MTIATTEGKSSVFELLRARVKRERFLPTAVGLVINPVYLIRRDLVRSIRSLAPRVEGRVLDFGCGSKPYEALFTQAREYIGIDIAISGHDHGDSKVDVFYDGKSIPFPDGSFDSIVAFEVFEHVFNINEILVEIRRVLRPGGVLLFSTPFAWEEHEQPYDFARYTSFGITHVLKRSGYIVDDVRKTNGAFTAISQLYLSYLQERVFPRNRVIRKILQLGIIFPLTVVAAIGEKIMPKGEALFSNLVVLARRDAND